MNQNHLQIFAVVAATIVSFASATIAADVPKLINYQGKLVDNAGSPLGGSEGGIFTVRFELHDAPNGGILIWGEIRQVPVMNGVFNVVLGGVGSTPVADTAVNDLAFAFTSAERYLEIAVVSGPGVESEQILSPRQQMATVPYAITAFNGVPPGTVVPFFGEHVPAGWLPCDGQSYPKSGIYERLFQVIGTACGEPDTSSFRVPDLRGRFLRGVDNMGTNEGIAGRDKGGRGEMNTNGNSGSEPVPIGTIQGGSTAMPSNKFVTGAAGQHDHTTHGKGKISHYFGDNYAYLTITNNAFGGGGGASFGGRSTVDTNMRTSMDGSHTHTVSGGDPETRPINAACNFMIKY